MPYLKDHLEKNLLDPKKDEVRDWVADRFVKTVKGPIRYLGLPGPNWVFEHKLVELASAPVQVTGVEKCSKYFSAAVANKEDDWFMFRGNINKALEAKAKGRPNLGLPFNWNAIWLDYCGGVAQAFDGLHNLTFSLKDKVVPVAVTITNCWDGFAKYIDPSHARVQALEYALEMSNRYRTTRTEYRTYRRHPGLPMLTMATTLKAL